MRTVTKVRAVLAVAAAVGFGWLLVLLMTAEYSEFGTERVTVPMGSERDLPVDPDGFRAALEGRFSELSQQQWVETCASVREVGVDAAVEFIRERHYALSPAMRFEVDIAAEVLTRECAERV